MRSTTLAAFLLLTLCASDAMAQRRLVVRPARNVDHSARDPYLPYGGVTLNKGGDPPKPVQPPAGWVNVNWPGFRYVRSTGTAEVFLQMTGSPTYTVRRSAYRVIVKLQKAQANLRNTFRSVITSSFPGAVSRFRVRKRKGGVLWLDIRLRYPRKPTVQLKTISPYTYLVVSFPRGRRYRIRRVRRWHRKKIGNVNAHK